MGAAAATERGGGRRRRVRAPSRRRRGADGLCPLRGGGERPLPRARRWRAPPLRPGGGRSPAAPSATCRARGSGRV